jgi:sterol desaturase/sphingolipid hydroxylase (fatty acid hydroxylase superfamily)
MVERPFLVAGIVLFGALLFLIERVASLRRASRPLLVRLLVNIGVAALAFATSMVLVRPAAAATLQWAWGQPFGLLHVMPMPPAAQFVVSFLLMDLTFYWWHTANHRVPFLWRFHNVHHLDPDLDVSTAFRFHPGEVALSAGFRVLQISAIGLSAGMFAAYELAFQANTLFHHSNIRLPIRLERALNLIIVTPRMHGIHHSQRRDEANSNYSVVLSWWDRLHRTLGLNVPQSAITVGVPAYSSPADNTFWNDLRLPFGPQRDYWRRLDGTNVEGDPATATGRRSRMAE